MVTTANVISYVISGCAILITLFSRVKDGTKQDSTAMTTVIVKLDNIDKGVSDIQKEMRDIRADQRVLENRVTIIETLIGMGGNASGEK